MTFHANREGIPKATSFQVAKCDSSTCGPHILALDENDNPMCELVLSMANVPAFVELLLDIYNGKLRGSH
jgi:hypothetical protein